MNIQVSMLVGKVVSLKLYEKNIQRIPDSCKVDIVDNKGTVILSDQTASVAADGTMSYQIQAADATNIGLSTNNTIRWKPVFGLVTEMVARLFDISSYTLEEANISDNDFIAFAPYLKETSYSVTGSAEDQTVPTPDTLTDTARGEPDGFFTGGIIEIFAGAGENDKRKVIDYTDGVFTPDEPFSADIDKTTKYICFTSYSENLQNSLIQVEEALHSIGIESARLIDIEQIRYLIMTKTAADLCFAMIKQNGDAWQYRYEELTKQFANKISSIKLTYDEDQTGDLSDETTQASLAQFSFKR